MDFSVPSASFAGYKNDLGYVTSYGTNTINVPIENPVQHKTVKKDNTDTILLSLGGLALLGLGAFALLKGKATALKNVKFNKGIAQVNGKNYTGKITHTYENGKKVVIECANGVIKKSTIKDGDNIITKTFSKNEAGESLVKIVKNGNEEVVNITQKQNAGRIAFEAKKGSKPVVKTEVPNAEIKNPQNPATTETPKPDAKTPETAPKAEKPAEPSTAAQPEVKPKKVITDENATFADLNNMEKHHRDTVDLMVRKPLTDMDRRFATENLVKYYNRIGEYDEACKVGLSDIRTRFSLGTFRSPSEGYISLLDHLFMGQDACLFETIKKSKNAELAQSFYNSLKSFDIKGDANWDKYLQLVQSKLKGLGFLVN